MSGWHLLDNFLLDVKNDMRQLEICDKDDIYRSFFDYHISQILPKLVAAREIPNDQNKFELLVVMNNMIRDADFKNLYLVNKL